MMPAPKRGLSQMKRLSFRACNLPACTRARFLLALLICAALTFLLRRYAKGENAALENPAESSTQPEDSSKANKLYNALDTQLRHIRDAENWRVLGDVNQTGGDLYKVREEKEANIAFFLQISSSNIVLVPRLLTRIWHPQNTYCLHFDEKIPLYVVDLFKTALKRNAKMSNLIVMRSTSLTYAGVSMLVNTLDSMHTLLVKKDNWDYFINLSGSDYPLVSVTAMRRLLGTSGIKDNNINFVHYSTNTESWSKLARHRLGRLHFDHSLGFLPNSTRELSETFVKHPVVFDGSVRFVIAKGEAWIIAHRTFCEQAAHGNVARRILALFANMQSASEHYFQTLGWNHRQLNATIARHSFRKVVWVHDGKPARQHPYYVDQRGSDGSWPFWKHLQNSPDFFARKFKIPDSALMEHIDSVKSGATLRRVNRTAVAASYKIVEKGFECVAEVQRHAELRHIMSCFWSDWVDRECKRGVQDLCVGKLPEPPRDIG